MAQIYDRFTTVFFFFVNSKHNWRMCEFTFKRTYVLRTKHISSGNQSVSNARSWFTATQCRVSQRPLVLMSDLLTAPFLSALSFNTSWCLSSCSTVAFKLWRTLCIEQARQCFISMPLESTSGELEVDCHRE